MYEKTNLLVHGYIRELQEMDVDIPDIPQFLFPLLQQYVSNKIPGFHGRHDNGCIVGVLDLNGNAHIFDWHFNDLNGKSNPFPIRMSPLKMKFKAAIPFGNTACLLVGVDENVYVLGDSKNQLHPEPKDHIIRPAKPTLSVVYSAIHKRSPIKDVFCEHRYHANSHCYNFVTQRNGTVISFGEDNSAGQLCLGHTNKPNENYQMSKPLSQIKPIFITFNLDDKKCLSYTYNQKNKRHSTHNSPPYIGVAVSKPNEHGYSDIFYWSKSTLGYVKKYEKLRDVRIQRCVSDLNNNWHCIVTEDEKFYLWGGHFAPLPTLEPNVTQFLQENNGLAQMTLGSDGDLYVIANNQQVFLWGIEPINELSKDEKEALPKLKALREQTGKELTALLKQHNSLQKITKETSVAITAGYQVAHMLMPDGTIFSWEINRVAHSHVTVSTHFIEEKTALSELNAKKIDYAGYTRRQLTTQKGDIWANSSSSQKPYCLKLYSNEDPHPMRIKFLKNLKKEVCGNGWSKQKKIRTFTLGLFSENYKVTRKLGSCFDKFSELDKLSEKDSEVLFEKIYPILNTSEKHLYSNSRIGAKYIKGQLDVDAQEAKNTSHFQC